MTRKVLLLTSYCGGIITSNCTDAKPCIECLAMCNTFQIEDEAINTKNYAGTLRYLSREKDNYSRKQVRTLLKQQLQAVVTSLGKMSINMTLAKGLYAKEYGDELEATAKRIRKVLIIKF